MSLYEICENIVNEMLNKIPLTFYIFAKQIRKNMIILTSHIITRIESYTDFKENITGIKIEVENEPNRDNVGSRFQTSRTSTKTIPTNGGFRTA